MIIAVDVDGVVADLHTEWLRRYNRDYQDHLRTEDISRWDMDTVVKAECGKRIYDYLSQPDLYDHVAPIDGAWLGVQYLRGAGHRVVFATSCVQGMTDPKWRWLQRHSFLGEGRAQSGDLIVVHDKSLIRADMLIDDYPKNLEGFKGLRLLFDAPYNRRSNLPRVQGWHQLQDAMRDAA